MTGFTTPWAPTSAELAACIECGLCLPHCPTFRLTGDERLSPRGRINALRAVGGGVLTIEPSVAEVLESCLQCRSCEAACPSLVPFGRIMEGGRAEVAAALPRARIRRAIAGRWMRRRRLLRVATFFAAVGQRLGGRRWLPKRLRVGMRGLRPLPLRSERFVGREFAPDGEARGTVGLLAGCVMEPWFGGVHRALIAVLTAAGYRVVVPKAQTCCGALAVHEGRAADADRMREANRAAFAGVDLVVVDSAGCSAHMREHEVGVPVEDAVAMVDRLIIEGLLPRVSGGGVRVGVQDPCHHRHVQKIVAEPRRILRAGGFEPIDVDPHGTCCGAAGLYSVARPATSTMLGRRRAGQAADADVAVIATANPGCEMQLRGHMETPVRVAHPIELYAEAVGLMGAQ